MFYGFTLLVSPERNSMSFERPESASMRDVQKFPIGSSGEAILCISNRENNYIRYTVSGGWLIITKGHIICDKSSLKELFSNINNHEEDLINDISKMAGQYCFIGLNLHTGKILIATDPVGLHSIFSYEAESFQCFSSNLWGLKNILPSNMFSADKVNQEYILRYGYPISGKTVYENVIELIPKKIFIGNVFHSKEMKSVDRLKMPCKENNGKTVPLKKEIYERLLSACKEQLGNCTKVGVLLGGFDSALIVSILHRLNVEVKTYSFSYDDSSLNQPYVESLTSSLDVEHKWVKITPNIIKERLTSYETCANNPSLWMNYVCQTQHLCKQMAEDGMQAVFSGDGCDSLFLGYPNTHRRGSIYKKLPIIGNKTSATLCALSKRLKVEYLLGHIARVLLSMIDASKYSEENRPLRTFQIFGPVSFKELTSGDMEYIENQQEYLAELQSHIDSFTFERKVYYSKSLISPNRTKMVSSSDYSGLNLYSPYLYPELVEFAHNIPDEQFRPTNNNAKREGKHLLMKMADDYELLPKEVIYQPKIAAIKSPIDKWLSDELYDFMIDNITYLPFSYSEKYISSLLKEKAIEKLYKNNFSNDGVVSIAASLLVTYASFFK